MTIIYYSNQKSPNIIVIMQWKYDIRDQRDELFQIIYERHELKIKKIFDPWGVPQAESIMTSSLKTWINQKRSNNTSTSGEVNANVNW